MERSWAMKWARDLEETSAKQARGVLNNGRGGFCCLGRLCVVAGGRGTKVASGDISYFGETTVLPHEVMDKVGMATDTGSFASDDLATLNDNGASFQDIAKLIRKNWASL